MRTRRLLVPLTVVAWVLTALVGAAPASAHAALVASSPSELQILSEPPAAVLLVFDEEVDPRLSSVTLTGPQPVAVGALTHGTYDGTRLLAPLPARMAPGDYSVSWRVVSTDDGHATSGSFSFRTLAATAAAPPETAAPAVAAPPVSASAAALYGAARWLAFLAFAVCVGVAFFVVACRPAPGSRAALRRLVAAGWGALLAASVTMLLTYVPSVERAPLRQVVPLLGASLASRVGQFLLLRVLLLLALAPLGGALLRRPSRGSALLVLACSGVLASTWSAVSHSERAVPLRVLDSVHLVSTAVWLGGLVAMGLVVLRERDLTSARHTAGRFSAAALVAVVLLVGTGCVQAWEQTGSVAALGDNSYARLLVVKVALVAVTLLLAALARFRVLPSRAGDSLSRLRRLVLAEAALGIGVLSVTSVLVTTEPARTAHEQLLAQRRTVPAAPPRAQVASTGITALSGSVPYDAGTGSAGAGSVQVGVSSTRVGATEIHLTVLDAAGRPRTLTRLAAALRPATGSRTPTSVRFALLGPGHYISEGASFPAAGSWQLGIALGLPGGATAVAVAGVDVR